MQYLDGTRGQRNSKTGLSRGAFGVVGAVKRINALWKKVGVALPLATKAGKIAGTRIKPKIKKNKYNL